MTGEGTTDRDDASPASREPTEAGNYFVANYPPFSFWQGEQLPAFTEVLHGTPHPDATFGLYVHIPFCRKRCDFCYFRVYTDNDARRVRGYIDAVIREAAAYADRPFLRGRRPKFIYFGGGTPSYLSVEQLQHLFAGLQEHFAWDATEEVTFECEPGTLQEKKIHALRELGVTRLSLGVENFDPGVLELNNRAHRAKEIDRAYACARDAGFPQINIDLIAGMVGDTDANWRGCIERTLELAPDSVTIYQMEIPFNTTIYRRMRQGGEEIAPVADWPTKRRWVDEAFRELEANGYVVGSAYTAARGSDVRFLYRDELWHGADMLGLGVASFSHLGGVHAQNVHDLEPYHQHLDREELPVHRALSMTAEEQLIRQFVLQLKLGRVDLGWFRRRFGVDPGERFREQLAELEARSFLTRDSDRVELSRAGLLQLDPLLQAFFLDEHRDARYA